MNTAVWNGIGVMSGTSLDGIDLAWCRFERTDGRWTYHILDASTFPYSPDFRQRLADAPRMSALAYTQLNVDLGELFAQHINQWIGQRPKPDFIASHGHTVFHQPQHGLTTQIGSGAVIAAQTGIRTVCDFRTTDVALGGQGAPLVPIGDEHLFGRYDACLNLGGFSNISFRKEDHRIAFDISPCNMALNLLANRQGLEYDPDGRIAESGSIIHPLLEKLNQLDYYRLPAPKSLGKEWFDGMFLPLLQPFLDNDNLPNCLRTVVEHIAMQMSAAVPMCAGQMLVTGGGAHNRFLIQRLSDLSPLRVVVPDARTVDYKEALVFAFLGLLRLQEENNCLNSVTGSISNNCGGAVYLPAKAL
ncbi:MAG: anhydro-N-acetylmuramic acid kinase [Bacteroidales bacterium]|nr:anhydro-N-acetylmuramic acid kinase [Bacteroidales bacterium]